MIATDSLSLFFVGCTVFSGAFLIITGFLGLAHDLGIDLTPGDAGTPDIDTGSAGSGHHQFHLAGAHAHTAHHHAGSTHSTGNPERPWVALLRYLNTNAILAFLFTFGVIGYTLHNISHTGVFIAISLAIVVGLVIAAIINYLSLRYFGHESGRLSRDTSAMEGRLGKVSVAIREHGIGEVVFQGGSGSRQSLGARSSDGSAIARDVDVVIVGYADGIALVQRWDDFMTSFPETSAPEAAG